VGARMSRDRRVRVVFTVIAVALIGLGWRWLQLSRDAQQWAVDHPKEWAMQNPGQAAISDGVPPPVEPWLTTILLGTFWAMLLFLVAYGLHAWLAGDDAPHFSDKDVDEQSR